MSLVVNVNDVVMSRLVMLEMTGMTVMLVMTVMAMLVLCTMPVGGGWSGIYGIAMTAQMYMDG